MKLYRVRATLFCPAALLALEAGGMSDGLPSLPPTGTGGLTGIEDPTCADFATVEGAAAGCFALAGGGAGAGLAAWGGGGRRAPGGACS